MGNGPDGQRSLYHKDCDVAVLHSVQGRVRVEQELHKCLPDVWRVASLTVLKAIMLKRREMSKPTETKGTVKRGNASHKKESKKRNPPK